MAIKAILEKNVELISKTYESMYKSESLDISLIKLQMLSFIIQRDNAGLKKLLKYSDKPNLLGIAINILARRAAEPYQMFISSLYNDGDRTLGELNCILWCKGMMSAALKLLDNL